MSPLTTTLKLERNTCIRGESVFFEIHVENTAGGVVADLPTLHPAHGVLTLTATHEGGDITGSPLAADHRDGVHQHGPETPQTIDLPPRQRMSTTGDILVWLGELRPGTYSIVANYIGQFFESVSQPVQLTIQPAAPMYFATTRRGQVMWNAPAVSAWLHRDPSGILAFAQQQSHLLPRNSRGGLRIAQLAEPAAVHASVITNANSQIAPLLWQDRRGSIFICSRQRGPGGPAQPIPVKSKATGDLLASSIVTPDGAVWAPLLDARANRLTLLRITPAGAATEFPVDLGGPVDAMHPFFEYDARFNLFWAAPRGREVKQARLQLAEPEAGYVTRSVDTTDDSITWIEAYLDLDAQFGEQPMFEEQLEPEQRNDMPEPTGPKLMFWRLATAGDQLLCSRVNVTNNTRTVEMRVPLANIKQPRVLSSVVTHRYQLALILADASNQLYYFSTIRRTIVPLAEAAGRAIVAAQFPGLMTAGDQALEPWVHVRFIDGDSIGCARLEPADQPDPVERKAGATDDFIPEVPDQMGDQIDGFTIDDDDGGGN
ncbi:MAG: hypothetical protein ACR2GY_02675 [Phycisphaerales bacterium]